MAAYQIQLEYAGINSGPFYNVYYSFDCENYIFLSGSSPVFLPNTSATASIIVPDEPNCIRLENFNSNCNNSVVNFTPKSGLQTDGLVIWNSCDTYSGSVGIWGDKSGNGNNGSFLSNIPITASDRGIFFSRNFPSPLTYPQPLNSTPSSSYTLQFFGDIIISSSLLEIQHLWSKARGTNGWETRYIRTDRDRFSYSSTSGSFAISAGTAISQSSGITNSLITFTINTALNQTQLYINGSLIASSIVQFPAIIDFNAVNLPLIFGFTSGSQSVGQSTGLNGFVRDLLVYNRVLTPTEVEANYNALETGSCVIPTTTTTLSPTTTTLSPTTTTLAPTTTTLSPTTTTLAPTTTTLAPTTTTLSPTTTTLSPTTTTLAPTTTTLSPTTTTLSPTTTTLAPTTTTVAPTTTTLSPTTTTIAPTTTLSPTTTTVAPTTTTLAPTTTTLAPTTTTLSPTTTTLAPTTTTLSPTTTTLSPTTTTLSPTTTTLSPTTTTLAPTTTTLSPTTTTLSPTTTTLAPTTTTLSPTTTTLSPTTTTLSPTTTTLSPTTTTLAPTTTTLAPTTTTLSPTTTTLAPTTTTLSPTTTTLAPTTTTVAPTTTTTTLPCECWTVVNEDTVSINYTFTDCGGAVSSPNLIAGGRRIHCIEGGSSFIVNSPVGGLLGEYDCEQNCVSPVDCSDCGPTTTTTLAPTTTTLSPTTTTLSPTTTTLSPTTTTVAPTTTIAPTTTTTTAAEVEVFIDNTNSLDVPITDMTINGVTVSYVSGTDFTINAGNNGNFTSTQLGAQDVIIYYGAHIAGQNIVFTDSDNNITCHDLNGSAGSFTISGATITGGTTISVVVSDGACS
jgi:ABC-type transporter Mla subunit MlaD